MPNTFLYKVAFIDNDFYRNTYNTAFIKEWDSKSDAEKTRFIELASSRIKSLASRPFVELDDLEQEQGEGVQIAVARLLDYWMEYGLDLNRISGSISQGSFSASQTVPSDPDYIPKHVFDTLQDVGLYSPVGFVTDDVYRFDDDREVTYGVRFKTLERIKEVSLDKTVAEEANKSLAVPTVGKVLEDIKNAKLSPFVIIGTITEQTGTALLPTEAELETLFKSGNMVLDDGTKIVEIYSNPANPDPTEHVPVKGEAIRVKLQNGTQETTDFDGAVWNIDQSKNASNGATIANTNAIAELNGLTANRAIKAVEGDTRYLRTDGSNDMGAGYSASNAKSVTVKDELDSVEAGLTQTDEQLAGRIEALEQAETLSDKKWEGTIALAADTDISAIVDQNGAVFDFTAGKKLEVVIEKTTTSLEQGHNLIIGAANATPYVIGTRSVQAKLGTNGHLVITGNDLSDLNVTTVIEARAAQAISTGYSKTESDAKYQVKTDSALVNPTDKTILGNVNSNYNEIQTLKGQVNSIDTSTLAALETKLGV